MTALTRVFWHKSRWLAGAVLFALLIGCGARIAPRPVLAERCLDLSAAAPITLQLASPGGANLAVFVRQQGISVSAAFQGGAASVSPIDRYGTLTLLEHSRQAQRYSVQIVSRDSATVRGAVCVSADSINDADHARLAAEGAFAAGGTATQARRWQDAFDSYLAAARGFDRIDRRRAAEARHAMAQLAYRQLDRNRDSYLLADRALQDFGAGADPGLRSALVELQASSAMESTDENAKQARARALRLLDESKSLAGKARFGAREVARLAILRGFLKYAADDRTAARDLFGDAAQQCRVLRDWECFARAQQNSAELAEEQGNNQAALQGYADALSRLDPGVAPELTADIWDNLGRLQGSVGIFTSAEKSYQNASRLYARIGECGGVRRVLAHLGALLVEVGSIADAVDYLQRSTTLECAALVASSRDELAVEFKDRPGARGGTSGTGPNAHPDAWCSRGVAPDSMTADGKFPVFHALLALSDAASLEGDAAVAMRCLTLARDYTTDARTRLRLANATGGRLVQAGDGKAARASFDEGIGIADAAHMAALDEHRPESFMGLAEAALLERKPDAAHEAAVKSLALSSARADVLQVIGSLQILGRALAASGDSETAVRMLQAAANLTAEVPIGELDAERRATYLATQHGVFAELTDLMIAAAARSSAANDDAAWAAFNEAEHGHARSFRYALTQTRTADAATPREHVVAQYQALLQGLAAATASNAPAAQLNAAIERMSTLARSEQPQEQVDSSALSAQLNQSSATLIEYASGRTDMYAFVIQGAEVRIVRLGALSAIAAAAADLFERLRDPEGAATDIKSSAQRLAKLVLWPVTRFANRTRVVFVPDDSLNSVPFAVLPWSEDAGSALVLQQAEVAVTPSVLFLLHHAEARAARSGPARIELIGDPIFSSAEWRRECLRGTPETAAPAAAARGDAQWIESLPRLPGSRAEVLAIAELARNAHPASMAGVHLGCLATPDALRHAADAGPQVLHIATHGYVDALRPRLSALALSRDSAASPAGGIFGLLDILAIKLDSRLVVLSACDTSRGRLLPGEGVLGPAQAFLQSGAASVLASYWRIDDAATAKFMQRFYKYLLKDHLPAAAALRRAQLDEAQGGATRTWAAFALYGWPDSAI